MSPELTPEQEQAIEKAYADGTIFSPANRDYVDIAQVRIQIVPNLGPALLDPAAQLLGRRFDILLADCLIDEARMHLDRNNPEQSFGLLTVRATAITLGEPR